MSTLRPKADASFLQRQMTKLARILCAVFYEHVEVAGEEHLPREGSILLCANHSNAIADAIILMAVFPGYLRPLARSGLFRLPGMRLLLEAYGAVPIYRRTKGDHHVNANARMFEHCYDALKERTTLLIFPEGQSHTDPYLHPFKTGAARIALGARARNAHPPSVIPVGLTFTRKGRFRGSVLVNYGGAVALPAIGADEHEQVVRDVTMAIEQAVQEVTLNTESWDQLDFLKRIERFVALRRGRYRRATLSQRYRALRRIARMYRLLRNDYPQVVEDLEAKLAEFERLCAHAGVRDYHLTFNVTPTLLTMFFVRALAVLLLAVPVGLWGWLNAVLPFQLTRSIARWVAKDRDQYDTAKMGFGVLLFTLFWWVQTTWVHSQFGLWPSVLYLASLTPSAFVALMLVKERRRLRENLRALLSLSSGRGDMRQVLEDKRDEIEGELTGLMRELKRRWHRARQRGELQ